MVHWSKVQCPWCWEFQEIAIEADLAGSHVLDCQVCCRPWRVHVSWGAPHDDEFGANPEGGPQVHVERS